MKLEHLVRAAATAERAARTEERPALLRPPVHPVHHRQGDPQRGSRGSESTSREPGRQSEERHPFGELRAHQVMARDIPPVYVGERIQHAAQTMARCDCDALPVMSNDDELVGVLTDYDIAVRLVARGHDPMHSTVAECMTGYPYICHANDRVADCLREMAQRGVRHAPVVGDQGELLGIVSETDLARVAGLNGLARRQRQ